MINLPYLDEYGPDSFEITGTASQNFTKTEEISTNEDITVTSINMSEAFEFISGKIGKVNFSSIKDSCDLTENERFKCFKWHYHHIEQEIEELAKLIQNTHVDKTPFDLLKELETSFQSLLKITPSVPDLQVKEAEKPEAKSSIKETAKFFELEKRINDLESTLGTKSESLTGLMAKFDCTSISQLVEKLEKFVDLVDAGKMSDFEYKLKNLDEMIEDATSKKEEIFKNSELIQLCGAFDSNSMNVSLLAQRLVSLKDLHFKAAEFVELLSQLSSQFDQLSCGVSSQGSLIESLNESLEKNAQTVQRNVDHLNERINSINL